MTDIELGKGGDLILDYLVFGLLIGEIWESQLARKLRRHFFNHLSYVFWLSLDLVNNHASSSDNKIYDTVGLGQASKVLVNRMCMVVVTDSFLVPF